MFIKFGDKTEKIVVKNSTNSDDGDEELLESQGDSGDDRRAHILKEYDKQGSGKKITQNIKITNI
jgi:hypothetical protein